MATPPDFAVGQVLTAQMMDAVAMWLIDGGTYTAADPIAITECFSSDFTHYRVVGSLYGSNSSQGLALNFYTGTNTLDNAANYNRFGYRWDSAAIASGNSTGQTSFVFTETSSTSTQLSSFVLDIFNPNEAVRTKIMARSFAHSAIMYEYNLDKANTSLFTGFQLDAAAGSLTGSVLVYGLRN